MQMIRPVSIGSEQLESSTANAQVLPEWAPEGRDLLEGENVPNFDVAGSDLWVLGSYANNLNRFDLPTGERLDVSVPDTGYSWGEVAVSPDGNWVALRERLRFSIYDASSGVLVYSVGDGDREYDSEYLGNVVWADDSSFVATTEHVSYSGPRRALCVVVDQWQETPGPDVADKIYNWGWVLNGLFYYFYDYSESNGTIKKICLGEFDPIGGSHTEHVIESGDSTDSTPALPPSWGANNEYGSYFYFYNPANNLFIITRDDGTVFSVDLNGNKGTNAPTGAEGVGIQSICLSQNGDLLIEAANAPYYREYSASDYSFIGNYPDAYNVMYEPLQLSTNYAVGRRRDGDGYALIDLSDNTEVSQNNPNVSDGDRYIYNSKIWEALADNNDRPDEGAAASPPTWVDQGFINPLRMFDGSVGSQTTADGTLEVSIKPSGGQVNALALLNMSGATARVTMTDPDGNEYYNSGEIALLDESLIGDWYAYFFEPYIELADTAITDMPPYVDGTLNITVDSLGSQAAIGELVVGALANLGETQYGVETGIQDYSRKERDEFGNFNVVERGYSRTNDFPVHVNPARTPGLLSLLAKFRATPAVYIGSIDRRETVVYGYYRDFTFVAEFFSRDELSIEVEGLQ